MKRKMMVFLLVLFFTVISHSVYAEETVNVVVNGAVQVYEVPAQLINNRTMLPLRGVAESLGMTVTYNQDTLTARMTKGTDTIIHQITTPNITINGKQQTFDTPSIIINNRTLVPLRMLAEAINAQVDWDPATRTAIITTSTTTPQEGLSPTDPDAPYMVGDVLYDPKSIKPNTERDPRTSNEQFLAYATDMFQKSGGIRFEGDPLKSPFAYSFQAIPLHEGGKWSFKVEWVSSDDTIIGYRTNRPDDYPEDENGLWAGRGNTANRSVRVVTISIGIGTTGGDAITVDYYSNGAKRVTLNGHPLDRPDLFQLAFPNVPFDGLNMEDMNTFNTKIQKELGNQ